MKLVSYKSNGWDTVGMLVGDQVYQVNHLNPGLNPGLPATMTEMLAGWEIWLEKLLETERKIKIGLGHGFRKTPLSELELGSPVPKPGSCRDGYAFRQHVESARRNRGLGMIPQFDLYPVFYFTNHRSIQGPGAVLCMPDHFEQLDFELEVAIVICKEGRNIRAADADAYIGGLMVMNDLSARTLQMEEMMLNLGPAKGKDFSTAVGPWLVTLDELKAFEEGSKPGHVGKNWDLEMRATVNGELVSRGNLRDMDWTFAEIIERASYGVTLYPGDIIGSGTVGTGCFLELNGTARLADPNYVPRWLKEGDRIELTIEVLGTLANTIVREQEEFSILDQKKKHEDHFI